MFVCLFVWFVCLFVWLVDVVCIAVWIVCIHVYERACVGAYECMSVYVCV